MRHLGDVSAESWRLLEASWGILDLVGGVLGPFGRFMGRPGASWKRREALFILKRAELKNAILPMELHWKIDLDRSRGDPGCFWAALGWSWVFLIVFGRLYATFGRSRAALDRFWVPMIAL